MCSKSLFEKGNYLFSFDLVPPCCFPPKIFRFCLGRGVLCVYSIAIWPFYGMLHIYQAHEAPSNFCVVPTPLKVGKRETLQLESTPRSTLYRLLLLQKLSLFSESPNEYCHDL